MHVRFETLNVLQLICSLFEPSHRGERDISELYPQEISFRYNMFSSTDIFPVAIRQKKRERKICGKIQIATGILNISRYVYIFAKSRKMNLFWLVLRRYKSAS